MRIKSISIAAATCIFLSTSVNAVIITHGDLTTDDATNYITDTATSRMYSRFDSFNLTYADTLTAIGTGGLFEGWSIATSEVAHDFINASLGGTSLCAAGGNEFSCGTVLGWGNGDYGDSSNAFYDQFVFLNNSVDFPLGLFQFTTADGSIQKQEIWSTHASRDFTYVTDHTFGTNLDLLLYKDVAAVPVPAAVWLFGSGLLGLIGVARRKKA